MFRRGEVWMAGLPGLGRKPAVIVSSRPVTLSLHPVLARVSSVPRERTIPTVVALDAGEVDGLPERSFVLLHDLATLPAESLQERLGQLEARRIEEIDRALGVVVGLEVA